MLDFIGQVPGASLCVRHVLSLLAAFRPACAKTRRTFTAGLSPPCRRPFLPTVPLAFYYSSRPHPSVTLSWYRIATVRSFLPSPSNPSPFSTFNNRWQYKNLQQIHMHILLPYPSAPPYRTSPRFSTSHDVSMLTYKLSVSASPFFSFLSNPFPFHPFPFLSNTYRSSLQNENVPTNNHRSTTHLSRMQGKTSLCMFHQSHILIRAPSMQKRALFRAHLLA